MTDGVVCELGLRSYTGRSSGDTKQSPKVESWASITKFSSILNCLAWVAMAAAKKKKQPRRRHALQSNSCRSCAGLAQGHSAARLFHVPDRVPSWSLQKLGIAPPFSRKIKCKETE